MKFINLSNIKIINNTMQLEFLYKNTEIDDNTAIYFEDEHQTQYICNVHKCKNRVYYSYNNEDVEVAKVTICLEIKKYGLLKMKIKDIYGLNELQILNNKGQEISSISNPYIIFFGAYKVQLFSAFIKVTSKKFGDKAKYNLVKLFYGLKRYHKIFIFRFFKSKSRKYYLFNDRLLYGDDNAEEFFKYININNPYFAKNCYFVLDKNSNSFERIKKIGKVLTFGSFNHKLKFLNSKMVLSSHASYLSNCFNPFSEDEMEIYKDIINKNFVFLQHGVVMNDIRQYSNRELITADIFITSTKQEYDYLSSEDYMYEPNMVVPTGLPRFDKLENNLSNVILISPTWRSYDEGTKFEDSEYFFYYKKLLTNEYLLKLLKIKNYKIKFLLHPVFAKYKNLFDSFQNEYIEILESSKIKYCNLFNECSLFITDYSSIHFDVATLKKPIIYFQFDKDYFFEKHYQKGYFDYAKDGFGKVIADIDDLIVEVEYYLSNSCKIRNEYKEKIENTFINLDHDNSKRVFAEVIKLDKTGEINYRFNNVH